MHKHYKAMLKTFACTAPLSLPKQKQGYCQRASYSVTCSSCHMSLGKRHSHAQTTVRSPKTVRQYLLSLPTARHDLLFQHGKLGACNEIQMF